MNDMGLRGSEQNQQPRQRERRKKVDILTRLIQIFGWLAWVTAIATFFIAGKGQPIRNNLLTRMLNQDIARGWVSSYVDNAFIVLLITFGICAAGLIFNIFRHKRKSDRFNKSLIVLLCVSLIGIVGYLVIF